MKETRLLALLIALTAASAAVAAPSGLNSAKLTEIHNEVRLQESSVSPTGSASSLPGDPAPPKAAAASRAAAVGDIVSGNRTVLTGRKSRAELLFNDNSIARLGANSTFSFQPGSRAIDLKSGFLLLHTPKGKGGAGITTPSASAAVLGTTIMLSATPDGMVKMVVLEGTATLTYQGQTIQVPAGFLVSFIPGQGFIGPVEVDLARLVASSSMINGFSGPLGSENLIKSIIEQQAKRVENGELQQGGVSITGDQEGLSVVPDSAIRALTPPAPPPAPAPAEPPRGGGTQGGGNFTVGGGS